jgi:replicative superfamily II helicase
MGVELVSSRTRTARDAERAAHLALGPRVDAVRELAAALLFRHTSREAVASARTHAAELLSTARERGDRAIAVAVDGERAATADYREAFEGAVTAGWDPAQLEEMGYARLTPTGRLHRPRRNPDAAVSTGPD